ncbi:MAG: rRNA maturation RNase YbeY [Bryobacteraceae bacterium]|nr:rRNA maturation RNase YbeY [Bryobacteraceae bacterium]
MSSEGSSTIFRNCPAGLDRKRIRAFQRQLSMEVASGAPFSCLLARDKVLTGLNLQFLGRDYPADVLSFPSAAGSASLGEIAISVDRAAEQGAQFGHSTEEEIEILMLHGVLHLIGMDHESDRGRMARAEAKWRATFGLPGALIERSRRRR